MATELEIYDLEGVLEEALAGVLRDFDLVISTPNNTDFQKERPRIELTAIVSGGSGRPYPEECVHPAIGQLRESAWRMQVKLDLITAVDIATHRALRATVRRRMAKICPLLNDGGTTLPNHFVHACKDAGSSPAYKGQDGFYQSTMLYDLEIQVPLGAESPFLDLAATE